MPKKLSEIQINEIMEDFFNGFNIDELAEKFNCTKITITRHLKNNTDDKTYKTLIKNNNQKMKLIEKEANNKKAESEFQENLYEEKQNEIISSDPSFIEITPLNYEIDNEPQKDLSSVPLSEVKFPNVVYMVVDKKIELEVKLLKDFPDWQFLSENELNRKTIEIFFDLKIAKRYCKKEQKVIKVPNTEVFKLAAPILLSRGISRIISSEKLIAL